MEQTVEISGVSGTMVSNPSRSNSDLWNKQKWTSETRRVGENEFMRVFIRFDDECSNGHNSFAITGEVFNKYNRFIAGGCLHEEIRDAFPELAHLIVWHLVDSDGPMHYVANTVFLAGDRDCNGYRKGEPYRFEDMVAFGSSPITHKIGPTVLKFILTEIDCGDTVAAEPVGHIDQSGHVFSDHYQPVGMGLKWHECPWKDFREAEQFCAAFNMGRAAITVTSEPTAYGDGKERELDAARAAACWPEATDEELSVDRDVLKTTLEKRLPDLLARFQEDIEKAGFQWAPPVEA